MNGDLAVVSGGTRGIGLAFSRRLVKLGHRVVGLYRDDSKAASAAADELGPGFVALRCDVADAGAVEAVAGEVSDRFGAPRVLVNNAGRNIDRPFLEMSADDWRSVVDTNLTGTFLLTRALAPLMLGARAPVIVNVGATTGMRPRLNGANYCASKAGVLHLTRCLALELAPRVRVVSLIPGMTETDELVTRYHLDEPAAHAAVVDALPLGRVGQPEDIADALEFLVGPHSAYMTGQKLIVDGGQYMW